MEYLPIYKEDSSLFFSVNRYEIRKKEYYINNKYNITVENGEIQEDLIRQANALACKILNTLDRDEKVDLKDKTADLGVQGFILTIGILLKMKGIIP